MSDLADALARLEEWLDQAVVPGRVSPQGNLLLDAEKVHGIFENFRNLHPGLTEVLVCSKCCTLTMLVRKATPTTCPRCEHE